MPEETLFDDLSSPDGGPFDISSSGDGPLAQSFSSGTLSVKLDDIKLVLAQDTASGYPSNGTITIELFSDSGGVPGSSIATLGTISNTALTSSSATYDFALASGPTLTANTTYWIELSEGPSANGGWEGTDNPTGTGVSGHSDYYGGAADSSTALLMSVTGNTCLAAGTRVLAARGEVPVEALRPGDHVMALRRFRLAPVRWIGHRHLDLRAHARPDDVNPIRIRAHAIDADLPRRDLVVSPDHALYLDGALIAARYLVNGATIVQESPPTIHYYHIELDAHDVVLAEGLGAESFLDVGNRQAFANGGGVTALHPDFNQAQGQAIWTALACAPPLDKGAPLAALRRRLLERAEALGHVRTEEPDLRVLARGRLLRPVATEQGLRFDLPEQPGPIRLLSRHASPRHMRAEASDGRILGVGVRALALDGAALTLDDPRLTSGWHAPEPTLRWTSGDACIEAAGARTLSLRIHGDMTYWTEIEIPVRAQKAG